jgi:hypothetical protein
LQPVAVALRVLKVCKLVTHLNLGQKITLVELLRILLECLDGYNRDGLKGQHARDPSQMNVTKSTIPYKSGEEKE